MDADNLFAPSAQINYFFPPCLRASVVNPQSAIRNQKGVAMTEPTPKPAKRHPLTWVPSLYFNQGLPNTIVREMGNLFFIAMNVPAQALGIFLGMFQLSWAFKFIWSPLVEMFGTKRGWIR